MILKDISQIKSFEGPNMWTKYSIIHLFLQKEISSTTWISGMNNDWEEIRMEAWR